DPNLQQVDWVFRRRISLTVPHSGARAHALPVAGMNDGAIADAVLVGEGAFEDVRDDLHVAVRMHREPTAGCNQVLIDHPQGTKARPARIAILIKGKCVPRVQPAVIAAATLITGSKLDHWGKSEVRSQNAEVRFWIVDFRL